MYSIFYLLPYTILHPLPPLCCKTQRELQKPVITRTTVGPGFIKPMNWGLGAGKGEGIEYFRGTKRCVQSETPD